jgi:hypothetical protein
VKSISGGGSGRYAGGIGMPILTRLSGKIMCFEPRAAVQQQGYDPLEAAAEHHGRRRMDDLAS